MKIETLAIQTTLSNGQYVQLFPTLIQLADQSYYLIDCGYLETVACFETALQDKGVAIADLKGLVLSHDDVDHLEALSYFKQANPTLEVVGGAIEQDAIEGVVVSERLLQVKASLDVVPEDMKPWVHSFISQLENIKRFPLSKTVCDGDIVGDSLVVIETPGHTKGHLSFFDTESKTLIASDALVIENKQLAIANPQYTLDIRQAIESIQKIQKLRPKRIICYHGGCLDTNVDTALQQLLEQVG